MDALDPTYLAKNCNNDTLVVLFVVLGLYLLTTFCKLAFIMTRQKSAYLHILLPNKVSIVLPASFYVNEVGLHVDRLVPETIVHKAGCFY